MSRRDRYVVAKTFTDDMERSFKAFLGSKMQSHHQRLKQSRFHDRSRVPRTIHVSCVRAACSHAAALEVPLSLLVGFESRSTLTIVGRSLLHVHTLLSVDATDKVVISPVFSLRWFPPLPATRTHANGIAVHWKCGRDFGGFESALGA